MPDSCSENVHTRIRELEREVAQLVVIMSEHRALLAEIRAIVNRPVNWPAWLGAACSVLVLSGGVLYAAFIGPLDAHVDILASQVQVLTETLRTLPVASQGQ